jgi:hypothetical protein
VTYVPFGDPADQPPALVDGTPEWMLNSLRERFDAEFRKSVRGYQHGPEYYEKRIERMQRMELETRMGRFADLLERESAHAVFKSMSEQERLSAFDWIIGDNSRSSEDGNDDLERILRNGGSKWKVGTRNEMPGLENRVPQGVQDAADRAMARPGDAGRLLSDAWHATYGMNPKADLGYSKSIEAVEAVVLPRVTPKDGTATLSKAIGQMRTDGDWTMPFIKEHPENPTQDVVLGMMQALWSGHSDRHPGSPNSVESTQEATEAAVSLAVTLVNLFANGGIARRP